MATEQKKASIRLNFDEYKDKVRACWIGKNIGGTMGTPYEGTREMLDVKGFATKENEVLPNDDLDLQLVWLAAVKKLGPLNISAETLSEFWLSYIVPYWNEYGIGKMNLQRGILPPLSGDLNNNWSHSNGAWIRTEIWACLAPAAPDLAASYAIEDAVVDHGSGEGTVAAAFVAAMQSAAFAISDLRRAIEVGLSKISVNSRVAQSIRLAMECYDKGLPPMETREKIRISNADIGDGWFESPSNVAYAVLGMLYGEGDFKKSMILAINCGDDTDCTAATVGATMGILGGMKAIPEDWMKHIGDSIVTVSINRATGLSVPKTCTELTEEVVKYAPSVLLYRSNVLSVSKTVRVELVSGENEIPENIDEVMKNNNMTKNRLDNLKPYTFEKDLLPIHATATYDREPKIEPNSELKMHIRYDNPWRVFGNSLYNLDLRWILPEGFKVTGPTGLMLTHCNAHNTASVEGDFTILSGENVNAENRLVLEVRLAGRAKTGYIPFVILGK